MLRYSANTISNRLYIEEYPIYLDIYGVPFVLLLVLGLLGGVF